jgi:NAD-dependent deacetylase
MNKKKKILVFTGAGVSKESGIETFRDSKESLWNNFKIEDVATIDAWKKDRSLVLNFYNERRAQLKTVQPNKAHNLIAELEKYFDVIVVTQNVDDLHERAGSTNVIHLHGELNKVRSTMDPTIIYDWTEDVNLGDKCSKGSQLRPHIVWFGEMLDDDKIFDAVDAAEKCDICIVLGTSMQVSPANLIPFQTPHKTPVYYIDPGDTTMIMYDIPQFKIPYFHHRKEVATTGMEKLYNELTKQI